MDTDCVIVRYAEIGLKGKNRIFFEKQLVSNIRDNLTRNSIGFVHIARLWGRIIIITSDACRSLTHVFGIRSFSAARVIPAEIQAIQEMVSMLTEGFDKKTTFRVSSQRIDKSFPLKSIDIDRALGDQIISQRGSKVSLKSFEHEIGVEIVEGKAYVFNERCLGPGGLPVGVEGTVAVLVENEISLLAALMMMKRGCSVMPIGFQDYDIALLEDYGCRDRLHIVESLSSLPEFVQAVAVGHTLETMHLVESGRVILRPLVGFNQSEISDLLRGFKG